MRRPRKPQFGRKLPLPKNVCPESTKFHGRLFGAREHEYVKRFKGQRPTSAVNFVRRIDEIVHTDTSQDSSPIEEEKIPSLKVQQQVKGAVYRWYMNRFQKLRENFDKYQEITEKEVKDTAKYYEQKFVPIEEEKIRKRRIKFQINKRKKEIMSRNQFHTMFFSILALQKKRRKKVKGKLRKVLYKESRFFSKI